MPGKNRVGITISGLLFFATVSACGIFGFGDEQKPGIDTLVSLTETAPITTTLDATTNSLNVSPPQANLTVLSTNALQIIKVNGFVDSGGIWTIVGLVENGTTRLCTDIEIDVELFDASGVSVYKARVKTALYNLSPGERTPFILRASDKLPNVDHYTATLISEKTAEFSRLTLSVAGVTRTLDDAGNLHITGKIENNSNQEAVIHRLAVAAFNSDGQIIAADAASVAISYLAVGQSAPFRVTMSTPAGGVVQPVNDQIYLDVTPASQANEFAIKISQLAYPYLDAFGWLHVLGEVSNNDEQTLNVRLLAAAYGSGGDVLDAASLDLPLPALAPGETFPYDVNNWGPLSSKPGLLEQASSFSVQWDPYWTWVNDQQYLSLASTISNHVFDGQYDKFTGQVLNSSAGPVKNIVIVVGLRDKSTGKIVGTNYTTILEEIPSAGQVQFLVDISLASGFDPESADYFVIAKGMHP